MLSLSLHDRASIAAAMGQPIDPALKTLLEARLNQAAKADLLDLTHILVILPGDTEAQVIAEIGFSPLVEPFDGARFGTAGFFPHWAWLHDLGGWYEMILTVGDTGFAFILLIERGLGAIPELSAMCAHYAAHDQCA